MSKETNQPSYGKPSEITRDELKEQVLADLNSLAEKLRPYVENEVPKQVKFFARIARKVLRVIAKRLTDYDKI